MGDFRGGFFVLSLGDECAEDPCILSGWSDIKIEAS